MYHWKSRHMNKTELKNLIKTYPKQVTNLRSTIKNYIKTCLTEYPSDWSLFQKTFHELYLEGSAMSVLCPVCHITPLRFTGLRNGYTQNCSASCRNRNPEFLRKYKDACLAKYGTEFASQSTEFRNTVKNTCMEKYGVDSVMKVDEIKGKLKKVFFEKYGVDKEGNTVGMSDEEIGAIEDYTSEGYKGLNSMLRAGNSLYDISQEERIEYLSEISTSTGERAEQEFREKNDFPDNYELTPPEQETAYDNYATAHKEDIDSFVF